MEDLQQQSVAGPELTAGQLYAVLALRARVFVVEQACPYLDVDGLDLLPGTRHLWLAPADRPDEPVSYLRILDDPMGGHRIGRVVTDPDHRGHRLGAHLLDAAMATIPGTVRIAAQSHLEGYYGAFGFQVDGPSFLEDGIPHTPMRR